MFFHFILFSHSEKEGSGFIGYSNPNLPDVSRFSEPDECKGINTIRFNKTKCKCAPSFVFGDPYKEGCYKCIDQCNESARCAFPGRCVCKKGLYGDGVFKCEIPKAIIADGVESKEYSSNGGETLVIMLKPYPRFTPLKGFCKFEGKTIVKANATDASYLGCLTPKLEPGIYKIFASFDNITWSDKSLLVEFKETKQPFISIDSSAWIMVAAGFISFVVAYKYISNKMNGERRYKGNLALSGSTEDLQNVPLSQLKDQ